MVGWTSTTRVDYTSRATACDPPVDVCEVTFVLHNDSNGKRLEFRATDESREKAMVSVRAQVALFLESASAFAKQLGDLVV